MSNEIQVKFSSPKLRHFRASGFDVPEIGDKIRNVAPVFGDPNSSGLFTMNSDNFEVIPANTVGEVEDIEVKFGNILIVTVVFFKGLGQLRARLGPTAWKR